MIMEATSSLSTQGKKEVVDQKYDDLISALPVDTNYPWADRLHLFKGYWFWPALLKLLLESHQHFKARSSDVVLATYPKSGTVWVKALLFATMNRSRYDPRLDHHPLRKSNPHKCVPFLEEDMVSYADSSNASPRALGTHTPYSLLPQSILDSDCRVVYLCRNPRDTLVSVWHFMNRAKPVEGLRIRDVFDCFCKGVLPYGPHWSHVLEYWNQSVQRPEKFLFLMYEEIKAEPAQQLKRLAEFTGYPFTWEEESQGVVDQILELCSFRNLSKMEVNKTGTIDLFDLVIEKASCFRRGEVGDWAEHFSHDMVEKLDLVMQQKLQGSGFKFQLV